ncbi:PadR family transcriptional regulator [Phormidium sp. FACHB-1136]|jgi:DNA-binding PadR family transcriptional regulator|uniref:PadR family transcriptional regulator n=1 Tax=Phormidium sp. FACHB-1136 TaxID=2692848 RepID=UPI0016831A89|nr:PadR family transcriptional regulator [Phormidium sp. FACHB-1136]MBD2428382.1 PadR family transcriptional regulator [Phormidium sp. FACHB-1136]
MALSHAILAALTECPCSGYDLAKRFDGSVGFFWHASHQQIYRELTKLEEQGLITAEVIAQTSRPDKKQFHVTPAGTEFLQTWIAQPAKGSPIKDELLVKLFVGYLVSPATLITTLQQERTQHAATLADYQSIEQQYFADPDAISPTGQFQYLTLRNGIHYETAWLTWCDEALAILGTMDEDRRNGEGAS